MMIHQRGERIGDDPDSADLQRQLSEAQTLELEHQATIRHLKAERDDYLNKAFLADLDRQAAEAEIARLREALERISCPSQSTNLLWWQVEARAALQGEPS